MRPDRNLALDLWQHESTHVLTDGRWREVELFLPADLNLSEVTDYPRSAILNASEAGEFVARLSVGTRIGQIGGWCKWRAHYLPGPPVRPVSLDRFGIDVSIGIPSRSARGLSASRSVRRMGRRRTGRTGCRSCPAAHQYPP
jgi:hypothetical protein